MIFSGGVGWEGFRGVYNIIGLSGQREREHMYIQYYNLSLTLLPADKKD